MPKARPHLTKRAYQARALVLRNQLVQLQLELKDAPFKVLLIVAGPEGVGRGNLLQTLAEWLDPRGVETFSYHAPTESERAHPPLWRFWRSLPGPGRIGLYAGSWYTETLREEARAGRALEVLADDAERIRDFEKLLVDGGTLIVKVWLHLSESAQGRRLRSLAKDPSTAWRVTDEEWHHHRIYQRLDRRARLIRARTDRPNARWHIVDAEDERARDLAVGRLLLAECRRHSARIHRLARKTPRHRDVPLRPSGLQRLQRMSLDQDLSQKNYDTLREKWLGRVNGAVRSALKAGRSIVIVFEGWDAAGKGGAIRRLTSAIDPRDYTVLAVGKPTPEEKHAHFLWRFWRDLPRSGRVAIFDRSWYGRVLVERVEGFCRPDEWKRAFDEINQFESQLVAHGVIVLKYWLHISHAEQLRRFRERESTPHKRHKMTDEDWRNRRQRRAYEIAVGDMLALTSTPHAPWIVVPADNKRFARLEVLRSASRQIDAAMNPS